MNKIYSNQARQIGILKPIANLCNGLSAFSFQLFVLFALALQLLSFRSNAQQYPVQVTPVLLPPYSLRLADYATTTDTKLQLYLLMRDLLEPSHQVRLRFSLESGINASPIAYSTPLVTGFKDVTLYPGTPLVLTNVDLRALFDLQNLSGISASDYARPLPQGIYRFSFQAFDAITQRTLSAKSFATAYFVQYDPPRLSLPQQGEKVLKQNEFQRIIFQWMPSQVAPNTKYIFTLKELWDNERDPVAGFLSSRALWQEEVYPNTLLYGIDKTALIPGKRYAWQVQAKSGNLVMGGSPTEDNGVYRNNGLSEIFYFDYVEDCLVPSFLMAKNVGRGRTEIRWNVTGSKPDGLYRIQYRKRGSTGAWEQQESYQEMATITGLEDVTAYEYRVGSVCGNLYQTNSSNPASENDPTGNAYAYSGIQNFTTDARGSQNTNYQCGVMPPVDITNSSPLQTALGVNEVFMAGDFPVTVLEAQGSNGTYSGEGYIQVPYLADTRIKVEFNNIRLNTDMKLIGGVIETSYDPNETSVKFVSDGIGETFGDQGIKEVKVAYTISKIEYVATPPPGKIVVSGNSGTGNANDTGSGTPSQQELPAGKDYAIIDKSGKIWNVDESGAVNEAGQEAKGGTSTAANTQGVTGTGSNTQVSGYTAKGIKIKWQESSLDTTFAFDTEEKTKLGEKGNYPKLKDADGNTVYVPFKAVVNGQTGYLDAKISIGDPSLKDAEIIFKTLKVGKAIDAKLLGKTDVERTYQLTLKGVMDYAEEEVLAVLMPKDSTSKQQVIGSFRLVHLSPKTVNVTLVPTDEASKAKLKAQGEELKRIYGKIGVKIEIKEDPILDISSVVSSNTINSEDAELMSTYSEQQQQINALYKGTADRYVVFVTSKTSSTGQSGYMRLNGQFGYVYQNATGKTTAHEFGHGVFKLEHPWKAYGTTKGTTNLLMDYGNGDELSHLEWKQVNDPALKIYSFQGQSSGELGGGFGLAPDFTFISTNTNQVLPDATIVADPFVGGFVSTNVDRSEEHYYWKNTGYETKDGKSYAKPKLILKDESVIWLLVNNGKDCEERRFIKTAYKEIKSFINASPRDINGLQSYIANHKNIPKNPSDLTQKAYGGSLGCGKTGNGTKSGNNNGNYTFFDYSIGKDGKGFNAEDQKLLDSVAKGIRTFDNQNIHVYILHVDNPNYAEGKALAEADAEPKLVFTIWSDNKLKLDYKITAPKWLTNLLPDGGTPDACMLDHVNKELDKLHNRTAYIGSPWAKKVAMDYAVVFYNAFTSSLYCATSEEKVKKDNALVKFGAGVIHEVVATVDVDQLIQGVIELGKGAISYQLNNYTGYFKDIKQTFEDAKAGKQVPFDEVFRRVLPPNIRQNKDLLNLVYNVGNKLKTVLFTDCGNTDTYGTSMCAYNWGRATVLLVPVVVTGGEWLAVKAASFSSAALAVQYGQEAANAAKLLALAEKSSGTVVAEGGKILVKASGEVHTIKTVVEGKVIIAEGVESIDDAIKILEKEITEPELLRIAKEQVVAEVAEDVNLLKDKTYLENFIKGRKFEKYMDPRVKTDLTNLGVDLTNTTQVNQLYVMGPGGNMVIMDNGFVKEVFALDGSLDYIKVVYHDSKLNIGTAWSKNQKTEIINFFEKNPDDFILMSVRSNSNDLVKLKAPIRQGSEVRLYRQDVYKSTSDGNGNFEQTIRMNDIKFKQL